MLNRRLYCYICEKILGIVNKWNSGHINIANIGVRIVTSWSLWARIYFPLGEALSLGIP